MSKKLTVKFTANFERNLEAVEAFLDVAQAPQAFDALLTELADKVIPNLERFPGLGRLFLDRALRSVEVSNGVEELRRKLNRIGQGGELREYVMSHYLVLYARFPADDDGGTLTAVDVAIQQRFGQQPVMLTLAIVESLNGLCQFQNQFSGRHVVLR